MTGGELSGRVVAVTGASQGLGRAITLRLAAAGADVVAIARNMVRLAETCRQAADTGGRTTAVECDITQDEQVRRVIADVVREHGRLDVVVNNAGIAAETRAFDITVDALRRILEVNVVGTFLVAREAARHMAGVGGGKIINIGSVMDCAGTPGVAHYAASKGAVSALTRTLAAEWARHGITVNCLAPGYVPTEINEDRLADAVVGPRILSRIPLRRFGRPDEVADVALFLASPASDYLTGHVLYFDGGLAAR